MLEVEARRMMVFREESMIKESLSRQNGRRRAMQNKYVGLGTQMQGPSCFKNITTQTSRRLDVSKVEEVKEKKSPGKHEASFPKF